MNLKRIVIRVGMLAILSALAETGCGQTAESRSSASSFRGTTLAGPAIEIDNALRKPVSVDYYEMRLADVLDEIESEHHVTVLIHESATEGGVTPEKLITIRIKDVPLHSFLQLILERYHCTLAIHNDALQVVSKDAAALLMENRIYDCRSLLERANALDKTATVDRLDDLLVHSVDPRSWQENGGEGQISGFAGKLVVSQSLTNHLAMERLLQGLFEQMK
jgi:hypothetical protein